MRGTLLPERQGPVRRGEREPERHQRPGDRGAAHRRHRWPRASPSAALLYLASRWLRGRTNRVLNVGLLAAGAVVVVSLGWLAARVRRRRGATCSTRRPAGSATVEAVAQVGIAAQEAHADESLTLIDNTGDDDYQTDYLARQQCPRARDRHAADRRG